MSDPSSSTPITKVSKPSSETVTDVKVAAALMAATSSKPSLGPTFKNDGGFHIIAEKDGIIRTILSFIIHPITFLGPDLYEWRHENQLLKKDFQSCLAVSKIFNQATWELTCNPVPQVNISLSDIVQLKKKIIRMDLSTIEEGYIEEYTERWDDENVNFEEYGVHTLLELLESLGVLVTTWTKILSRKYKEFLFVKALEYIATTRGAMGRATGTRIDHREDKNRSSDQHAAEMPTDGYVPSERVEWFKDIKFIIEQHNHNDAPVYSFWHKHMLSPVKYYHDCMELVGGIIDNGGFRRIRHVNLANFQQGIQFTASVKRLQNASLPFIVGRGNYQGLDPYRWFFYANARKAADIILFLTGGRDRM